MKRPMAAIGIAYLAAQIAAIAMGRVMSVAMCVVMLIIAAASFILLSDKHRRMVLPVLVSCAVAFGSYSVYSAVRVAPAEYLAGQTIYIRGEISKQPYEANGRYYYIVDTDYIEAVGDIEKTTIRISGTTSLEAEITDIFEGTVTVNLSDREDGFSETSRRIARGVVLTAYIPYNSEPIVTEGSRGLPYFVSRIRNGIEDKINGLLPKNLAVLLRGMLLGDKSEISDDTIADFRICGLSHLLAVSGLHMSLLVAAMTVLLRRLELHYRVVAGVLIGFVWSYVLLTGFSYSVIRAALMTTMILLARVLNREADSLNSLGVALLVICLANPYAAADAGLLLSASSTMGLILLAPRMSAVVHPFLNDRINDKYGFIHDLASDIITTVAASLCSMPVLMLYFGEYSLITLIANILCVKASTYFMISGAIAVVLSLIPFAGGVLSRITAVVTWLSGKLLLLVVGLLSSIPGASVRVNYRFLPVFFISAGVLLAVWYILFRSDKKRVASLGLCMIIIAGVFATGVAAETIVRSRENTAKVYSVGDGIAVVLTSGNDCAVIGAGGDRYDLWRMVKDMQDNNIAGVDAVFFPDSDDRYASYGPDFIKAMSPDVIFVPEQEKMSDEMTVAVLEYSGEINNVAEGSYSNKNGSLTVECFTDKTGLVWVYACAGTVRMLVCPENGNCADIPQNMRYSTCVVLPSSKITNFGMLTTSAVIISAEEDKGARAEAVMLYRGAKKAYSTARGNITVSESGAGYLIGDE